MIEKEIPGGILLFFPSYEFMTNTYKLWQDSQLQFTRKVFMEQKDMKEFDTTFKKYMNRIQKGEKAALFCVCRGKLSEGIDFKDQACRAIFVIGLPFASVFDPRVM